MNKLQKFVIVRRHKGGKIDVIGTNSGQAFVEKAAQKHASFLHDQGGSYQVLEIARLNEYLTQGANGNGTSKTKDTVPDGHGKGDGGGGDDRQSPS